MSRRVVVTGIGVISPVGTTLPQAWKTILSGQSHITQLTSPEYAPLPCRIAGLVSEHGTRLDLDAHFAKSTQRTMGRATCYALLAAQQALTDSRLDLADPATLTNTGVAVGMGMVDLADICATNEALQRGYNRVSPHFVPRILPNMAAGHVSIRFGLRGPNHAVSTACATGAHAIGDAYRFVRHGDAEAMVCGGAEACISPLAVAAFCRLRALSTSYNATPARASRPFDKAREGFVMGEGSAILVLEELEQAKKRKAGIYAEVLGYGLSGDAAHLTAPKGDGSGAILAMERTLKNSGVDKKDVGYINAHATSTPVGDAIEMQAIRKLFGDRSDLAVSSTKGAHGHLLGAAGNLESVFAIKAVEEGWFPPTVNLENVDGVEGLNFVKEKGEKWEGKRRRIALKNAFGFGGTNACLCFGQYLE